MNEFDTYFVESLLEGVKAKVRSIEAIMLLMLYLNNFFYLEINSLFREKTESLFLFFKILYFNFCAVTYDSLVMVHSMKFSTDYKTCTMNILVYS